MPKSAVIMWSVAAATLPVHAGRVFLYGGDAALQLALLIIVALACEALALYWQKKPRIIAALSDGSAVATAAILAPALPPAAPWFVAAGAAAGALLLAKHCYGGLGNNPFNPAMVGYILVFFAFPEHFTRWADDAVASPTPLAAARLSSDNAPLLAAQTSLVLPTAAALGGAALLLLKFADWRLVLFFGVGAFVAGALSVNAVAALAPLLLSGGLVFAAFFVITDPVTAPSGALARGLYAFITGALAVWLRQHGAHTDSIAFAIIIGNMFAPLCDHFARMTPWKR